ncbi:MAG TPA: SpoIIE family protein phosphatase [Mycobacteriales bacterium]|nr:SpoIIE family protein phosphatase [Mycobacteriales bacterium]
MAEDPAPPATSPGADSGALYRALVNSSPDLTVFVFGSDLRHIQAGGLAFDRLGWRTEDIVGRRPSDLLDDGTGAELEEHMRAALAGETRVFDHAGLRDTAGFWRSTVVPVRDESGNVVAGMVIARDVAPVHQALEAMLDSVTIQQPVFDESGQVADFRITYATENAVDFAGRRRDELLDRTLRELFPELGDDFIATYAYVLQTGEGVHFNAFPYPDANGDELLYDLAVSRVGDALLVTWREVTEREAGRVELARVAAVRSVSEQLQRGLLPSAPPVVPGLRFAATYHPALETAEVGGDWYDVVRHALDEVADDVVDVIVGDVEGHDGHAAARMARYSTLVRAACCRQETVDAVVEELRDFHSTVDAERLVTIALARVDVATGAVTLVSAGHPPPVVRRASGQVDTVDLSVDPPIGAPGERADLANLQLEPGATLVMFSDGLLDPQADPDDAYRAIAEIVSGIDPARPEEIVAALEDYARGHQPSDDVVVVAVHRHGEAVNRAG